MGTLTIYARDARIINGLTDFARPVEVEEFGLCSR